MQMNLEALQSLGGNSPWKRPKVRDVDQGQGNLDSNPETMDFETLQSLGGNPQKRECNWMTIQMRWTVDHHKHSVPWVRQKEFWKGVASRLVHHLLVVGYIGYE
ncbi:unnamed protein product [Meganyctiphanes norvegica]|uniref:Uncharacterized protein n=1 Tax=Meganyctiphanes norvegica TaxID=48144 RepID=A0AAV2PKQ6_MEGNR